eukprot:CAMPEP_0119060558 /NCGR_PEP_ID=MMETSP1178-20130426/4495_1 /TAXON_ID=33656 /ORGANISM="unid sp, Strain CCMP2000" /LENGTH=185 /DNA_ID=CAMNT_0007041671 /DNA_START=48 /DNA_END=605 /DNA_ORIENTATION=-
MRSRRLGSHEELQEARENMQTYTNRISYIYFLLAVDTVITSVADTMEVVQTQAETIMVLMGQLTTRILLLLVAVTLLGSTPALRAGVLGQLDSLMLAFRSFFAVQLMAVLACLFLRVYRVMLASYTEEFPTIQKYWEQPAYHLLYLLHIGTTLLSYYSHISSAHALGVHYSDEATGLTAQTVWQE